jgi:hypothetical protein
MQVYIDHEDSFKNHNSPLLLKATELPKASGFGFLVSITPFRALLGKLTRLEALSLWIDIRLPKNVIVDGGVRK